MTFSKQFFIIALVFFVQIAQAKDTLRVCSPSGKICVNVWLDKQPTYSIAFNGKMIVAPSFIDLTLEGGSALSHNLSLKKSSQKKISETIVSPVPEKRKNISDVCNELTLQFKQPYQLQFRAYNDGVAYRIITAFKDSIVIKDETAEFHFPSNPSLYYPDIPISDNEDPFKTSFEHTYAYKKMDSFPTTSIAYSPILITPKSAPKIAITESDLEDYPGMFVTGTGTSALKAVFAKYPLENKINWAMYSQKVVIKRADYIARTGGTRTFPWRIFIIAEKDKDLPSSDMVYRLSSPSRIGDVSWIKPGNITDEWIIDLNLYNVPFKAGRNTASYKYYVDFAKQFGISHIMMDAGWSDNNNLLKVIPDINMDSLLGYAKSQGVKIALWTLALTLDRQLDSALDQFNKWGIDFIMTDFIDHDDQLSVRWHHRIAEACAKHHIMLMFHGSYPPKGFNRTYPNAVAREAVLGSEYNIWSDKPTPDHDLLLPFIRMLAGYLDYEPGLLNNQTKKGFRMNTDLVMSQGTRCHQLAMLVTYDNPMQFFSGNPSQGLLEPEFMSLWGSIPTTWDEAIVADAEVGNYIVTERKKGNNWYVSGMTNWSPRDINISFDFLDTDGQYKATICKDGVNADHYAADYLIESKTVKKGDTLNVHLAPGGGFLMKLEKE